ncbi:MAG: putative tartrate transporter [Candidatus Dichloromethanomonas elyunquensis]|nr:MAG: putative tartrate transporter [Candidatus Dichloromethanomonas elyunquensis]
MDTQSEVAKRTIRKLTTRIIPYIFILYIISFLDRVNIGYAALTMNKALSLSSSVFGLISGIFFIGYFIFEVPSNIILHKIGARIWIARIMVTWGIVVIITAWAANATHLYILRFLLGLAEAGFFPGIILYLTLWFPAKQQARAIALFMSAMPVSNIIGAPISAWFLGFTHLGWEGWRWLFVWEGLPAVIFGIITIFYLTDRPEQAKWLSDEEKNWLTTKLKEEHEAKIAAKKLTTKEALANRRVWYLSLVYFFSQNGLFGVGFWLPTIIKGFSNSLSNQQVGFIAMIPYIVAGVSMIFVARHSDRTGERRIHTAIPPLVGAIGLIGSGMSHDPVVQIIMLSIATAGIFSYYACFWSMTSTFLTGAAAAVGIAVINSIGNLGGFVGPYTIGLLKDATGSVYTGLYYLGGCLLITSLLILALRKENPSSASSQSGKQAV